MDLGVGTTAEHEVYTQRCAEWLKWRFDRLEGDAGLIVRMLNGEWEDKEFLAVEPGRAIRATNREDIVESVAAPAG